MNRNNAFRRTEYKLLYFLGFFACNLNSLNPLDLVANSDAAAMSRPILDHGRNNRLFAVKSIFESYSIIAIVFFFPGFVFLRVKINGMLIQAGQNAFQGVFKQGIGIHVIYIKPFDFIDNECQCFPLIKIGLGCLKDWDCKKTQKKEKNYKMAFRE